MSWILDFYRSPMGRKAVMAVTGVILIGFIVGHMLGNLKIYKGQEALDHYAAGLREVGAPFFGHGELLWAARIVLLMALFVHLHAAITLTWRNRKARGNQRYAMVTPQSSTYASRTMLIGGFLILAFVVYHLMHLTFGIAAVHPEFESGLVFQNVVKGLGNPVAAGLYILANVALGFHLYHGTWSLFQTLGWNGPRWNDVRHRLALLLAVVVALANISFPVAVLAGVVKLGG